MFKNNVINIIGTFAVLALSFLFLVRAAAPGENRGPEEAPPAANPASAVEILSFPADAIIIEALPAPN